MSLVGLLVAVLIVLCVLWLISIAPVEPRIRTVLQIIVVVFFLLLLLGALTSWGPTIRVS